jgi:hypothetical protein
MRIKSQSKTKTGKLQLSVDEKKGAGQYGEVESKMRFPLPHTLDGGYLITKEAALH